MSGFSDQLEEIKSLISSAATKANKSFAYSTLLHLQQQSSDCDDSIQMLARSCRSLIRPTVADVRNNDEEIATQALKCLGFMIYHPSIVAEIAADDVKFVLDSLAKLITTTKMKSVCNLGVWCISIQQLSTPLLAAHFHSLLLAIVHAIDNPIGSLSTTFEAIQAVVKDLKPRLLTGMHHMLTNGMKVQTIQAWGWFIRLLGSHALKNRQLINQMLKIPEQTFSDHDSQVQIASQVAWEGLIENAECRVHLGAVEKGIVWLS
ncbi:uncharacterized protein LOC126602089 isoform X3 [Malus sylvestris]|uniref:uncharacterized protein LOC126602089 isoform X3 n=1 Tax=Malus sylvestris TaxID=3752 RepID=UPI0021AC10D2|nr:uncharacterized protein LOC126602089 isoform X3 [Malus sylvestris]